jgi:hypothetical protein
MPNDPQGLQNLMTLAVQQALGRIPVSYMPATSQPQTPKAIKAQPQSNAPKMQAPPMPPIAQSKAFIKDTDDEIDAWLSSRILAEGESGSWSAGGSTVDEEGYEKATVKTKQIEPKQGKVYNKALGRYQTRAEARGWARQILRRKGYLIEGGDESKGGKEKQAETIVETQEVQPKKEVQPTQIATTQTEETSTPDRGVLQDLLKQMQTPQQGLISQQVPTLQQVPTPQQVPIQEQPPIGQTSPLEGLINTIKGQQQQQVLARQMQPQQIAVATLSRMGLNTNTPEFQAIAERASKLPPATLGALTTMVQRESGGNSALTQFIMDGLLQLYGV